MDKLKEWYNNDQGWAKVIIVIQECALTRQDTVITSALPQIIVSFLKIVYHWSILTLHVLVI